MPAPNPLASAPVALAQTTLAQLAGPDAESVPELPAAPIYETWLLDNPVPLAVALGALALVVAITLVQRGKAKPALLVGLLGGLLAAGAIALGSAVTTPRETITQRTDSLVRSTAAGETDAMRDLLHPDVALRGGSFKFIPNITGRERLLERAESLPRDVVRVVVLETRAGLDSPRVGRTQVRLRVFGPNDQLYGHSWWGLDWQQHEGEWSAVGIEPLWIQGG